jgi:regulator of sigma E protease
MYLLAFLPILSLMMIVHELGHYITARLTGIQVLEFGIGLPPRLWGFERNGVIYSINWIPFGAFVKMLGEEDPTAPDSFASKPRLVRAVVLIAGSAMNFLLAVVAFSMVYIVGVQYLSADGPVQIAEVSPDSPASAAGLLPGDTIVQVNGQSVDVDQFRTAAAQSVDQPMQLTLQRPDGDVSVSLTPRSNPPAGQGALGIVLGTNGIYQPGLFGSIGQGTEQTVRAIGITFMVPKLLLEGAITPSDARPIGLPGMAQLTAQAVEYSHDTGFWYPVFFLTGMFSAGLAVANMLPIPALDGGRLFFVILESLRGRRIPPEREAAFHFVGIVVLLTLMLIISINDITQPIPTVHWGGP